MREGIKIGGDLYVKGEVRGRVLYLKGKESSLTCVSVKSESLESEMVVSDEIEADNVIIDHVYALN